MTEGPLGFPLTDKQAFAIEALLKSLPREPAYAYRKTLIQKQPTEISDRSDVSWISTEDPDRADDVVIAKGMNDSQFRLNPIVTLNHSYAQPPVGKSIWRKYVKDGGLRGIKAKTQYPPRPADWNKSEDWPADTAFALVQSGLLLGKSIGFLPTKIHLPTEKEPRATRVGQGKPRHRRMAALGIRLRLPAGPAKRRRRKRQQSRNRESGVRNQAA